MSNHKKILILGATSAIAKQAARFWASQGCSLYLMARDEARLQSLRSDLKIRGAEQVEIKCVDLSQTRDHTVLTAQAAETLGRFDIVLIAYGILGVQSELERDVEASIQVLQTNLQSVIAWLTVLANRMEQQGFGTISVIGSVAGLRGRASNYVYGASKGGLMIFLQGLRSRLAKKGVHVLTVLPGFVDTPMTAHFQKNALWASPQRVADDLIRAIENKKNVVYTPWYWRWIMSIVLIIPERIFKRIQL